MEPMMIFIFVSLIGWLMLFVLCLSALIFRKSFTQLARQMIVISLIASGIMLILGIDVFIFSLLP